MTDGIPTLEMMRNAWVEHQMRKHPDEPESVHLAEFNRFIDSVLNEFTSEDGVQQWCLERNPNPTLGWDHYCSRSAGHSGEPHIAEYSHWGVESSSFPDVKWGEGE